MLYPIQFHELGVNRTKGINVVIFFTHVDAKCTNLQTDTMRFLDLHEKTRIKHSCDEHDNPAFQGEEKKGSAYCKELLKDSLMGLTHFCHTVMKMKTAIASVSSKEMTNDIQEPESSFHSPEINTNSEPESRFKRTENNIKALLQINGLETAETKAPSENNIITSNKHTEVFQIRTKRNSHDKEDKDIKIKIVDDKPLKKHGTEKPPWDVLDIMKHVRYSFLGKIFEDTLDKQIKEDQDDVVDISRIGKEKEDPGLFSMVKSTMDTLLDPPEAHFLMVVFGGHLSAVADKHSAVVQSIKHIIENTDPEKTLIIVTGSCSEDLEAESKMNDFTLPVYAKGPNNDMLTGCNLLYDVPLTVRKILEVHAGTGFHFPEAINT